MTPPALSQPLPTSPTPSDVSSNELDDLYRSHRNSLLRLCALWLNDPVQAEDVVHDSILKAYASIARYDRNRPIWPWLLTIARRSCVDHLTRTTSRPVPLDFSHMRERETGDLTLSQILNRYQCERLAFVVRLLPERQRRTLLLGVVEGWSYPEIASFEGISVKAARQRVVRARKRLRQEMVEAGQADSPRSRKLSRFSLPGVANGPLERMSKGT